MTSLLETLYLPPIDENKAGAWPSLTEAYNDIFANNRWQQLFLYGLFLFYCLNVFGCYIFDNYVPLDQKRGKKYNREIFANDFISLVHSLMLSISGSLVVIFYGPMDALNASQDGPVILLYGWCGTFSASYFALDALLMCFLPISLPEKAGWVVHHFILGMFMSVHLLTNPIITYCSAMVVLVEWSTVALNVRIFAKLWRLERLFFISGWVIIIVYPLTRIVWNGFMYLLWISIRSEYLTHFIAPGFTTFTGSGQVFVAVMSMLYYVFIIMAKPSKMYILKK